MKKIISVLLIILTLFLTGCVDTSELFLSDLMFKEIVELAPSIASEDDSSYIDVSLEGMDVYYDYEAQTPKWSVPNNLLESDAFLSDYEYSDVEFHFFMKNYDENSEMVSEKSHCVNILILSYNDEVYAKAKNALFSQNSSFYLQNADFFSYNGYDFYERHIDSWENMNNFPSTQKRNLLFHVYNDEKQKIILMNFEIRHYRSFFTFEEEIDFFKYYYGAFYDFDA